jgi:hypothetical protein
MESLTRVRRLAGYILEIENLGRWHASGISMDMLSQIDG